MYLAFIVSLSLFFFPFRFLPILQCISKRAKNEIWGKKENFEDDRDEV